MFLAGFASVALFKYFKEIIASRVVHLILTLPISLARVVSLHVVGAPLCLLTTACESTGNATKNRRQLARFKATEGIHPSHRLALRRQCGAGVAANATSSELTSLTWAPLYVLQHCTIFLLP